MPLVSRFSFSQSSILVRVSALETVCTVARSRKQKLCPQRQVSQRKFSRAVPRNITLSGRNSLKTYVALLRAVNVGGNSLPTRNFIRLLQRAGAKNIRTYIQTGNAVFQADEPTARALAQKLKTAIHKRHGFSPEVILMELDELENAIASNPFPDAENDPKSLHLTFWDSVPLSPDLSVLEKIRAETERFSLKGRVFYFYSPSGIGRSKLASRVEKLLGLTGTARNWRTSGKILEMARQLATHDQNQTQP